MPQSNLSQYSDKQKRQASHIEASEKKEGRAPKVAKRIAFATVNKQKTAAKKKGSSSRSH